MGEGLKRMGEDLFEIVKELRVLHAPLQGGDDWPTKVGNYFFWGGVEG